MAGSVHGRGCRGGTFKSLEGKRCVEEEIDVPKRVNSLLRKENASPVAESLSI